MKLLLIALGIAVQLLGVIARTSAHVGERVYPIFELTDEDLAVIDITDGSVDDWLEVVGEPSLTILDFVGMRLRGGETDIGPDPADLDFRIWLAWHDGTDRIYGAIERADDEYVNECGEGTSVHSMGCASPASVYDGTIGLRIDGDHSGGGDYLSSGSREERRLLWHQGAQAYEVADDVFGEGPYVGAHGGHLYDEYPFFVLPPYAEAGSARFGEQPVITVTEFYITLFDHLVWDNPEESRVSNLFSRKIIGLDIGVNDYDQSSQAFYWLPAGNDFNHADISYDIASEFCDAVLLGSDGGVPDISAVGSITWGRIKATLEK